MKGQSLKINCYYRNTCVLKLLSPSPNRKPQRIATGKLQLYKIRVVSREKKAYTNIFNNCSANNTADILIGELLAFALIKTTT